MSMDAKGHKRNLTDSARKRELKQSFVPSTPG